MKQNALEEVVEEKDPYARGFKVLQNRILKKKHEDSAEFQKAEMTVSKIQVFVLLF